MARKPSGTPRIITYTADAKADNSSIYKHNRKRWGNDQAIAYRRFVNATIREYAQNPASAAPVEETNDYRVGLALWPGAREGHRIFFRQMANGILALRMLHTKRNSPDRLDSE